MQIALPSLADCGVPALARILLALNHSSRQEQSFSSFPSSTNNGENTLPSHDFMRNSFLYPTRVTRLKCGGAAPQRSSGPPPVDCWRQNSCLQCLPIACDSLVANLMRTLLGNRLLGAWPSSNVSTSFASCSRRTLTTRPSLLRALPPTRTSSKTTTTTTTTFKGQPLDKAALDGVLRRRMFYTPSFEVRASPRQN